MIQFTEHHEIQALQKLGVTLDQLAPFQVICLPENLATAESREALVDAGDATDLAKALKEAGLRCGTSFELFPEARRIDRRGSTLWLGLLWIRDKLALPVIVEVLKKRFTASKDQRDAKSSTPSDSSATVNLSLRVQDLGRVQELEFKGDADSLVRILHALKPDQCLPISNPTQKLID